MAQSENNLIWLDMEMTGLDPQNDRILEMAVIVTDSELNVVAEGPVWVVHQSDAVLAGMDEWNQTTHGRSGLIDKVRASTLSEDDVVREARAFLEQYVPANTSPMCGNSIGQDRRFMARWMPELEAFFHYRNLDVSTLKELCKRWRPDVHRQFKKRGAHTALADIRESIDELQFYRDHFLKAPRAEVVAD
ncbi:oligoribonuclease [Chitinibacteraceae bacterium HSL-7]